MVIPVASVSYTHPFCMEQVTITVGGKYIDWQGDMVGEITYLQIFTGTGIRIQLKEPKTEHWIHWGRIIEWQVA